MTTGWGFPDYDDHEGVHLFSDPSSGLRAVIAIHSTELGPAAGGVGAVPTAFAAVIGQIVLLDLVFSIDSIITAVGMTEHIPIMVVAILVTVAVMLFAATPLANFIHANPSVVMLALGFLIMIGMTLIAEGAGAKIPKGFVYSAMVFSALVETLNILARRAKRAEASSQAAARMPVQR